MLPDPASPPPIESRRKLGYSILETLAIIGMAGIFGFCTTALISPLLEKTAKPASSVESNR